MALFGVVEVIASTLTIKSGDIKRQEVPIAENIGEPKYHINMVGKIIEEMVKIALPSLLYKLLTHIGRRGEVMTIK